RDRDNHGQTHLATLVEDERVATRESVERQRESPEAVADVWIRAGEIDDEVGARAVERARQGVDEEREVLVVAGAILQLDVERAGDFVKRIVSAAVHAEREHSFVAGEDLVRSVPLLYVEVDDRRARNTAVALQRANRDGHIVEDAESFAVRRKRVMRAPREVHGDAVLEGARRGRERAARRPIRPLDERFRPRKPESPFLVTR